MEYKVSLYKPIEVEIAGQKFLLRKVNQALFKKMAEFAEQEEKVKDKPFERIGIMYEELKAFVDAPADIIEDLSPSQVEELMAIINETAYKSKKEKSEADAEKNGLKPGEGPAA